MVPFSMSQTQRMIPEKFDFDPIQKLLHARSVAELMQVAIQEFGLLGSPSVAWLEMHDGVGRPQLLRGDCNFLQDIEIPEVADASSLAVAEGRPILVQDSRNGVYLYPLLFRDNEPCPEAREVAPLGCLATHSQTVYCGKRCDVCSISSYCFLLGAVVPVGDAGKFSAEAGRLGEVISTCMAQLHRLEHASKRAMAVENTIGQMRTVMDAMFDPVILTDTHQRPIVQNRSAERFFRHHEVAPGSRSVARNRKLLGEALEIASLSTGPITSDITLYEASSGKPVRLEAVSTPTVTPQGRRTGTVTVMRDVTKLRRASEELRDNYERLRSAEEMVRQDRDRLNLIIENVGDPIVVCDRNAAIVLLDPLAEELFGHETNADSVRSRNAAEFQNYITGFTNSLSDRESAPVHLIHPDTRQEMEYDAHSGKIYGGNGELAYSVTVLRDLTALRRVEQLKVERRMLEMEKFAAAGRLAGTIAHEVNNPLEAIKNCIYLLESSVSAEAQPVYDILKTETERVARIVRQMLGLYRNTKSVGPMDVNAVVEDTLMLFSRQIERAGIRVRQDLEPVPVTVASADQLRQVLSNLVVNAKDSMSQGGQLRVRTRFTARNGLREAIRITVADTGSGIPKAVQANIFQPFVTTKGERGTGLGLWIVKGIIENHGGRLHLRSKVGHGTVFQIDLPVVR